MTDLLADLKPWNTVREVADHFNLTEQKVYNAIARYQASLPDGLEAKKFGKEWRIAKVWVARWAGITPTVVPLRRTGS